MGKRRGGYRGQIEDQEREQEGGMEGVSNGWRKAYARAEELKQCKMSVKYELMLIYVQIRQTVTVFVS